MEHKSCDVCHGPVDLFESLPWKSPVLRYANRILETHHLGFIILQRDKG